MASYKFSKSFAPPTLTLRDARLLDDRGDEANSQVPVKHRDPYDVTERELGHYFDVWGFLPPEDVLFYAFAVFRFTSPSSELPLYLERWLGTVDSRLDIFIQQCSSAQVSELRDCLANYQDWIIEFDLEAIFEFLTPQNPIAD